MRTSHILVACFALLSAALIPAQAIQLKGGRVLVGEILDVSAEGLSFHRLDNGGLLELRWEDLASESAVRIKHLKGLLVEDEEEITVEADVIRYSVQGSAQDEVVGLVTSKTADRFFVERKGVVLPIARRSIKSISKRQVPVYEVYTREGYYALKNAEIAPGDDADKHILLADVMRRVGDFMASQKHLLEAQRLGGGHQRSRLQPMLSRLKILMESEAEREVLKEIRILRNKKSFVRAMEKIAEFRERFPNSKLQVDFEREQRRYAKAREQHMIGQVYQRWSRTLLSVARDKATSDQLTLSSAKDFVENHMAGEIFAKIAESLKIETSEVEEFWQQRHKHGRRRADLFSYGVGSWVLGEAEIISGTKLDAAAEKTGSRSSESRGEWERITRKLEENRKRSRKAARRNRGGKQESDEQWWRRSSGADRQFWLRAYFAENGGQMELSRAFLQECVTCSGNGFVRVRGLSGPEQKEECHLCHGTKHTRTIRAR